MGAIPVVDVAEFTAADQEKLLEACRAIGCFRVVNHGIPPPLQAEMKAAVRSLFDLPADVKRRNADAIPGSGYVAPTAKNPLYEAFGLYDASSPTDVDAFCSRLDLPPHLRETIKSYACKLHELVLNITSKITESIGVDSYSFSEWPCQFRLNKYNFTEETVGSTGVQIHTDNNFLTVLQEDDCVGGLEVMDSTGAFLPVDPVPGTLLVNLGDVTKVWSNGLLHNVKHRVQCKQAVTRISIALFLLAPRDDIVETPAALVDPKHPRLYRTFSYDEYRKLRLSSGLRAGEALSFMAA
ncbi:2-oxoglutarate-dependent dioxygenase DAO-like isoform X2 [Typha latifolia]|uniref:2-oxoglutarate-dependent dioxygenase DAO-like isoform X2 n=1 Tax=Typha latifolia TaxID=4733 RepID=UPI003C2B53D3